MSGKLLISIIDFLPDATLVVDGAGRVIAWNRAMEEMTGVKREHMLGQGDYAYSLPFYGTKRPILIDFVQGEGGEAGSDYDFVRKAGNTVYAEAHAPQLKGGKGAYLWGTAIPLLDDDGLRFGAIESIRDISERKAMEEELRFRNVLLTTQQESSIDGIVVVDGKGTLLSFNEQFIRMWNLPPAAFTRGSDDLFVKSVRDRLANPEEFVAKVKQLRLRTDEASREEIGLADGRTFDCYSAPMIGPGDKYYGRVWYFRDITSGKQAEQALKEREAELEAKSINLSEVNTALKVLLKARENDRAELEQRILSNIKALVFPYLEKLKKCRLEPGHSIYVDIVETNLKDIISPFLEKMSVSYSQLTPTEVEIANLIKTGKRTKEIGDLLHISSGTVKFHRNNLRKKLGLIKGKSNLRTHLLSLAKG